MGGGFMMSNTRKSIKPASKGFQRMGHAIRVTSCPPTSSMTTCDGSFLPQPRASRVAEGMPTAVIIMIRTMITGIRAVAGSCVASPHQSSTAASEPHVPGAGRRRPTPKEVATAVAHFGAVLAFEDTSVGLFDMAFRIAGIVGLRIVQRRGDDVSAARPLAEVNGAATLAAEGEVRIAGEDEFFAGGTPEAARALLLYHRLPTERARPGRNRGPR